MAAYLTAGDLVATIEHDGSLGSLRYEVLAVHGHAVWVKTVGCQTTLFLTKGAHEIALAPAERVEA